MRWIKGNKSCVNLEDVVAFTINKNSEEVNLVAIMRGPSEDALFIQNGFTCEEAAMKWIHLKLGES